MNYKNRLQERYTAWLARRSTIISGLTLMLALMVMVIGCDSIVDQNTEADTGIATSDISGVLSVVEGTVIECIDPEADEYNIATDSQTIEWGNKNNPFTKTVEIEYYNTLTEFVLKVSSTQMIGDVLVDDVSIKDVDGTVEAGTWQEFTLELDEGDTQTFTLKVAGKGPAAEFEVDYTLLSECVTGCGDPVIFTYNGSVVTYGTVTSANEKCWLDRNLGAANVGEYGDLYQWGRAADGHQIRNSGTRNEQSDSPQPDHSDFIIDFSDWLETQNDELWQVGTGINNPCPVGYRLPTEAEWQAERQNWITNDEVGAFKSPLKLPVAGNRNSSGSLGPVATYGRYWSGTIDGMSSRLLFFGGGLAGMGTSDRALGYSVRCLKEDTSD